MERHKPALVRIYDHVEIHLAPFIDDEPWHDVYGPPPQQMISYEDFKTLVELKIGVRIPEQKMRALYQLVERLHPA